MRSANDLTSLLASRICHDLVSPVGAIVNGTDLVRELAGEDTSPEIDMIAQSAERASAHLQFYRIAFGASEDESAVLSRVILQSQADQMIASDKVKLLWSGLDGPPMRRLEARMLFQILMCARLLLGMRGRLEIRLPSEGSAPLSITALPLSAVCGQVPVVDPALIAMLRREPAVNEVTARQVEFGLVHGTARGLGLELQVEEHTGHVVISAREAQSAAISLSAVR